MMTPNKLYLLPLFVLFATHVFSQSDVDPTSDEDVYTVVQRSAQFQGGVQGFYTFLGENLTYPEEAFQMGKEGSVYVQFIIEKDGSISDVVAIRGIGAGCDEEAVRALNQMPNWKPALHEGKLVRQQMVQKITFRMPEDLHAFAEPTPASAKIIVDQKPVFSGGAEAYFDYLENIELKCKKCPNARFIIQFFVEKNGAVRDVEIVQGKGTICDERLMQSFRDMPKWEPARAGDKAKRYGFLQNFMVECD
ncbi:MAG: energy transducer TonB [Ekhidna sp.]|nr:energy transducer TonB [Ekhidna sp.]